VAGELAHALTEGSAATGTDIRIAQAGLRGVLSATDIVDPAIVASRVMASRQRRIKLASESHTEAIKAQVTAAQDQVRAREDERRHDKERIKELQAEVEAEKEQTNRVQQRLADVEAAEEHKAEQGARRRVLDLVLVLHAVAIVLLLVYGHPAVAALTAVSAVILWARLQTWIREGRATFVQVLVAAVPDLVTVGLFVWNVLGH
jgi:Flp pilus assembly protein TadB